LIRDNGAMVRQMGLDRHQVARQLALQQPLELSLLSPTPRMRGQQAPADLAAPRDTPEEIVAHLLHDVWNRRRLDVLSEVYRSDVIVHSGGGRLAAGVRNLGALLLSLMASMPDATVRLEHTCRSEEADGVIVAVRWVLEGTTKAGGLLGEVPGNQQVSMPGISHFRFVGGKIAEEWTLFDEIACLVQAYRGHNAISC
jgi:predicted ester cyclase